MIAGNSILLSRAKIESFERCQRQFQLRYVSRLTWPNPPMASRLAGAFERGQLFHDVMQRHFLGLPIDTNELDDDVRKWWETFQKASPDLTEGTLLPEFSLSVPIAEGVLLFGRIDLLKFTPETVTIIDWKTERNPRTEQQLRDDWQTNLYLAMLVEGATVFEREIAPEQVSITYWFAQAPEKSVTINYDSDWHRRNLTDLKALSAKISRRLIASDAVWPLTDDHTHCTHCPYRALCERNQLQAETIIEETDPSFTQALEFYLDAELPDELPDPTAYDDVTHG